MKEGQKYSIRNATLSGEKIIEGVAKLVSRVAAINFITETWMVQFENEAETYRRIVYKKDLIV